VLDIYSALYEDETMMLRNLNQTDFPDPDSEPQEDYPDEVLESEWNPVLEEIHALLLEPAEPAPAEVEAASPRHLD